MPPWQENSPGRRGQAVLRFIQLPTTVLACRILLGATFILTGGLKVMAAPEEMEAIFRAYQIIPVFLFWPLVYILPWVELVSGAFCLSGYLTRGTTIVIGLQLIAFILVLSTVVALGIQLEDCGCFGALGWREGPKLAIGRDVILLAMAVNVVGRPHHPLSLDALIDKEPTGK